uniref:Putative basic juvenile hormone sensitive hemolymph protein two n=1 Tax=Panstrongylus lignarius TaxID=156445 RepID=A0A224X8M1_9HEMI
MKLTLFVLGLVLATAYSSVVSTKPERKLADADFLKRQKLVLELYFGLGNTEHFHNEYTEFDFKANAGHFHKPEVVHDFLEAYHHGFLPLDGTFTLFCHHTRHDTVRLFDLFYFAKDFDTFYRAASWARKHLNPVQFALAYTLVLLHREDCHQYALPPIYEVLPNYFVPADTLHQVFDAKLSGVKERKFTYNNTGYEYNYHGGMYGGPLDPDAVGHLEYKISYLREDVGANNWYAVSLLKFPLWMNPKDYRDTHWHRRGESLYYKHQQIYARYVLERIANGLPYVEPLNWYGQVRVGYNPRVVHLNGLPFFTRPDHLVPLETNKSPVKKAKHLETRIYDAIDAGAVWEVSNTTLLHVKGDEGTELLGQIVFGVSGRPNKKYFGCYYCAALEALGFAVHTSSDHQYVGGALTSSLTALRDPLFYQWLGRLVKIFQYYKGRLPEYTHEELGCTGVKVKDFDVDKLVTYHDNFEYEVTNAVPVHDPKEYSDFIYYARQYRLNHKPYTYKLTLTSDESKEVFVRLYIGPKYDSEDRELTLDQKRLAFVEIDRFPAKLVAGENVLERNSKESPFYAPDHEGFKHLYNRVSKALNSGEQYYYTERHSCGVPHRYQLPRGSKSGKPFTVAVVVTPFDKHYEGEEKDFYSPCGNSKLYDSRPLGFPFDRPVHEHHFHVPNIFFKDVHIVHKYESDVNRT